MIAKRGPADEKKVSGARKKATKKSSRRKKEPKVLRLLHIWSGKQRFLWDGRIMIGPKENRYPALIAFSLLFFHGLLWALTVGITSATPSITCQLHLRVLLQTEIA